MSASLCEVPGLRVGHAHDTAARTGCTVILPPPPAIAGVDVRGSAPGSREIEALKPVRLVQEVHGILFTGGSAFGLNAAAGVQRYLEEQNVGFDVGVARVPIVPAAVIFDLHVGDPRVRPTAEMAYQACCEASTTESRQGAVGAGCGATVGKVLGVPHSMAGGLGMASWRHGQLVIGVLAVVNAYGDIVDPQTGMLVAGARQPDGSFLDTQAYLQAHPFAPAHAWSNTTLVLVATNAQFNRVEITKVAQMAQDGLARAIRPAHTPFDGDMVFAISCGTERASLLAVGALAADLVAAAIVSAVRVSNS
ncbi:MAG: P1 family peptidase [candidate division KSB1 bacterium]|nr:P1 family peptidase [candidate division KSB1 bacterium]MDZ7272614.1 P1 family peptidase [candidate division KSB1 bacterium]MDZ7284363.1 P1 family peptidase [candidate division KSB1 bacterium]MDZ7297241.1 P1 family peptidase [candidate division KSB1 bacterium]MDZ7308308.1 P1 family peptidase [candidate division KSB1 bacterium]